MNKHINYIDLFAGIGGFALGLQQAGYRFKQHFFSEIDPHAIAIYKRHFPKAINLGDITNIKLNGNIKPHLITFGYPCQDNSQAGNRKGQKAGTRSGLLYTAVKLLQKLQPPHFLAENVKGLYSVNEGADFVKTLQALTYLGTDRPQYTLESQLLNTRLLLPQNRERIYFVGHRGTKSKQQL